MTPRVADLGDILAHTWATPAPTTPQPTPPPPLPPASPWQPRVTDPGLHRWAPNADRQTLTALCDDIERLLDGPVS